MQQSHRAGADIGGTFTDLIVVDQATGEFHIGKTLTTPEDPSLAVETVLRDVLGRAGLPATALRHLIHGTTLVTNAMIERKGAKTALITSQGFRDSIEIGRETRYDLYDLMLEQPKPLVPRYLRFEVPQRTLWDGTTHTELDTARVAQLAAELAHNGIEAVAIVFLHSFTNPEAEIAARDAVQRVAPAMRVSISSDVVPEIGEFERASTTIANVYVQELVEKYLRQLEHRLEDLGFDGSFYLMLSSGGIATVDTAVRFPVRLLESGPAAGALAARAYGLAAGHDDLISFDMGGTTAKICVIDRGEPLIAHQFEVDRVYRFAKGSGLPIQLPVIELIEIGTGGGSIARVDSLGLLKAGPDSAGAEPGPVCYDRGGEQPTITDANLILGYLDPSYFLGGRMALECDKARRAVEKHIAGPLAISVEEAAWGIHQIANENMANAARVHALEQGKDPRRFPLFAFGGAGPVHAYRIALSLGSPLLLAPLGAGVMSTVGFLTAPLAFDFVRSWVTELDTVDWRRVNDLFSAMESEGLRLLADSGVATVDVTHRREVDMRYVGQGHEIRVALGSGELDASAAPPLKARFEAVYQQLYERSGPPVPVEILNWRVVSSGPSPEVRLRVAAQSGNTQSGDTQSGDTQSDAAQAADVARKGSRPAYFPEAGGFTTTAVYDRYALHPGHQFAGPAIVEERESTVIVGPDAQCRIDRHHNLVVRMPDIRSSGADREKES
ncbi:MAG: hydantoinase/oxoprolinase family protein [Acidobacteriota bacterium]